MERVMVRSALIRIVFVVVLALVAMVGTAHAESANAPAAAAVAGALFTPARTEEGITWSAHWVLTPESARAIDEGETLAIRFAVPLARGERLEPSFGIAPILESGRIAGVRVERTALVERTISATVFQPLALDGGRTVNVGAPIAAGTALQIVDGDLGAGARFEITTGHSLERRVGYVAPPGTSSAAREEARRLTGYAAHLAGAALYVRGEDVHAQKGLEATLMTARSRAGGSGAGITIVFGSIVVALFAAVRKLRRAASAERADALLAADIDALGAFDSSPRSPR